MYRFNQGEFQWVVLNSSCATHHCDKRMESNLRDQCGIYIYMQHYLMSRKDRLAMEQVKHKSKMDFFCQYTETSS